MLRLMSALTLTHVVKLLHQGGILLNAAAIILSLFSKAMWLTNPDIIMSEGDDTASVRGDGLESIKNKEYSSSIRCP